MSSARLNYLLRRYYDKSCTSAEKAELLTAIGSGNQDELASALLDELLEEHLPDGDADPERAEELYANILAAVQQPPRVRAMHRWWWAAAVAAVLVMAVAGAFWLRPGTQQQTAAKPFTDVAPGTNKAMLTLADGSVVALDSIASRDIQQHAATVHQQNGRLVYEPTGQEIKVVQYNTLSTPRGGQFRLTLPDGTQVWLNAASSIRYPVAFRGNERKVDITGEVYFEVVKSARQPFRVRLQEGTEIEVLGTRFNINAYADENAVRTTLAEGSVKVSSKGEQVVLQPGQQALIMQGIQVMRADVAQVLAWKNGIFNFENNDLEEVMRQLSRWYDVDVHYTGRIPERNFGGELQRSLQLSQVLEVLREMKLNVRLVDGKRIEVMP